MRAFPGGDENGEAYTSPSPTFVGISTEATKPAGETMNPLNDFGLKIFLDRYAMKDTRKETLVVDDVVVVCTNQKTRQREVGHVLELVANEGNKPRVRVKLLDGSVVEQDWDDVDKPLETTPEQTMSRTARGIADQEGTPEKKAEWEEKFKWLLDEWRFVPGGRILTAAGTDQNLTYFNCFSRETPVHLDTGIVEIGTLSGTHNVLSQGGVYRPAEFKSYGVQRLWRVELADGEVVHATAEHEWLVLDISEFEGKRTSSFRADQVRTHTRDLAGKYLPTTGFGEIEVISVRETERVEEVFCCVEPETHTITIGSGLLTGQCYVVPSPKDSRQGIISTLGSMMEIMSRGGGVGINLSSLRPRYAYVKGVNGRSSGSVSWGGLYSFVTGLIEQGGSRRGALLMLLSDWHPDVFDFIDAKREAGKITNANISIGISDSFMQAVENDGDWELVFPDTTHEAYGENWTGDLEAWRSAGYPVVVYKTVKARELWHKIAASAWASAEPGVLFIDRANKQSNSWYFSKLICTNPCGEQYLPKFGVCNLGAVNLGVHVRDGVVLWDDLAQTVRYAVRFLDNVIDATPYFIEENKQQQTGERRIGLGIMGLAEMLIRCGVRYGSDACVDFIDKLGKFIATAAYTASSDYAAEKGAFPEFEADKLLESGFMKGMPKSVRALVRKQGLRNVTLLTVAPTGTTGTMVNTSTGVEPYFSWSYFRKSRLGVNEVEVDIVREWREANPSAVDLPDYFITAMELAPEDHVKTQAAMQRWIDSSISKTTNAPHDYTVDQVREMYELMYRTGCKGGTIYRDGSRDEQVLNLKADAPASAPEPVIKEVIVEVPQVLKERKRTAKVMVGLDCKQPTHLGTCYTRVNYDNNFDPLEIFVQSGKTGSDIAALAEGLGRVVSAYLSIPSPVQPMDRLRTIAENLSDIGGSDSIGFGVEKIKSLPDAVGKSLYRIVEELEELKVKGGKIPAQDKPATEITDASAAPESTRKRVARKSAPDLCPVCGQATYVREEGCKHCTNCGHSACG